MSAVTSATSGMSSLSVVSDTPSHTHVPIPEEPLKASAPALDFCLDLKDEDFKYILFTDKLVTTSDTGKELGEFTVSVERTRRKGQECFFVHATSHGAIDNVPCGTSIKAFVSDKLETLEQEHHEYVKLESPSLDRKTLIIKTEENYLVTKVIQQGDETQRSQKTFSHEDMSGFISEGSNLVLQRLLVKRGVPEDFQMLSFDSETHLCRVTYRSLDGRVQRVKEEDIDVIGVERTISSVVDMPTTWQSYFTADGHLTNRVQVGSPVTMTLVRPPTPVYIDERIEKPEFGKRELDWEDDAELYSRYLDRKEELRNSHNFYLRQHPELRALLADFTQFLLLRKPHDTLEFAADYFSSFSAGMAAPPPYLNSAAPSPYPMSRSNTQIEKLAAHTNKVE